MTRLDLEKGKDRQTIRHKQTQSDKRKIENWRVERVIVNDIFVILVFEVVVVLLVVVLEPRSSNLEA